MKKHPDKSYLSALGGESVANLTKALFPTADLSVISTGLSLARSAQHG